MKNKYLIGIICAIVLVFSISAIFGIMYYDNYNMHQISGHNNMIKNSYCTNNFNTNHNSYLGNNFHNINNINNCRGIIYNI